MRRIVFKSFFVALAGVSSIGLAAQNITLLGGTNFTVNANTNVTINGNVTVNSTGTVNNAGNVNISGNWANSGTAAVGAGLFKFNSASLNLTGTTSFTNAELNGAALQTVSASAGTDFGTLTINNSNGVSANSDIKVNSLLDVKDAIITTNANSVSLGTAAATARTSGYVKGNLRKAYNTGPQTFNYIVGTNNGYSPVSVDFANVTTGGTLNVQAIQAVHPNAPVSNEALARYWTFTEAGGIAYTSYDAVFNYRAADFAGNISEATDEATMRAAQYASSWTYPVVGARNTSGAGGSIEFTGITSAGDFTAVKDCGAGCASNTWVGNTTQWATPSNWSAGSVPNNCSHNVVITSSPAGGQFPVISSASYSVGNLEVQSGATVTINGGRTLSICGDFTGGGSSAANFAGAGKLIVNGSIPQQFTGRTSANTILVNNTSSGVTVTGNLSVATSLEMQSGDIRNLGTVTLLSNATNTAYLDNFTHPGAGIYNGNLTMQRYVANSADGYRDISSAVATNVADIAADVSVFGQNGVHCWYAYNPYPNLQYYNEGSNSVTDNYAGGFWSYTGTNNQLSAMKGLALRLYAANNPLPLTLDFTGTPYNDAQSVSITNTPSSITTADGWNLVGNPYPSPIKWSLVKALNSGKTDGSYYAFSTTGEFTGNWASHNGVTGVNGATDVISSSQGFFVLASGNHDFDMDNSVRFATATAPHFKAEALSNEIRLTLSNGVQSDEIVAYTDPSASSGYDAGHDAVKIPAGSTAYLSYATEGKEYAINVLNDIDVSTELPLIIWAQDTSTYNLSATKLNVMGLTAYLKDAQNNTLTDLTALSIPLQLNGGETYNRYSVVFREIATGIDATEVEGVQIYAYDNIVVAKRNTTRPATIAVYNALGQLMAEEPFTTDKIELAMGGNSSWYAIVKVTEGDSVHINKVFVKIKQ